MLMACVLASTDTVAALTLVKPERYPKLNAILFGEGVVNDAVSILLFNTVKNTLVGGDIRGSTIVDIAGNFVYLSFMSILLGVLFALTLALVFKRVHTFSEAPLVETCLIILVGYSSYLLPEILELSGLMITNLLNVAHYALSFIIRYNVSVQLRYGAVPLCVPKPLRNIAKRHDFDFRCSLLHCRNFRFHVPW